MYDLSNMMNLVLQFEQSPTVEEIHAALRNLAPVSESSIRLDSDGVAVVRFMAYPFPDGGLELQPSPRPDLSEAIATVSASPVAAAVALSPDYRRAVQETFPAVEQPLSEAIEHLLRAEWLVSELRSEPDLLFSIVARQQGEDTAAATADAANRLLEHYLNLLFERALEDAARHRLKQILQFEHDGSNVVFRLRGEHQWRELAETMTPYLQTFAIDHQRSTSRLALRQLAVALHNYHDANRAFPPHYSMDGDGRALLSWRVHLLPFLNEIDLYREFRLDEPWDSEHNLQLIERMPAIYRAAGLDLSPGHTLFALPAGDGAALSHSEDRTLSAISKAVGSDHRAVLVVELDSQRPIVWTKPDDWQVPNDDAALIQELRIHEPGIFFMATEDASVLEYSQAIDPGELRKLLLPFANRPE